MPRLVPLLLLLVLAGCAKRAPMSGYSDAAVQVNLLKPPAGASQPAAKAAQTIPTNGSAISAPLLAYTYQYTFALPDDRILATQRKDQEACAAAGPSACQVVGSTLNRAGRDIANASLDLQASPAWIARFRAGADVEAKTAGGWVDSAGVTSEDLTRSIVDTEATVRAKTTVRDRIQKLLAERPGKLSDVLDAERALADVQGELDASSSELAVMRARVATSKLTINYETAGVAAPQGPWRPLRGAADDFAGNAVLGFSVLLTVIAFLLPVAVVIGPLVWLILRARRKRKAASEQKAATPKA